MLTSSYVAYLPRVLPKLIKNAPNFGTSLDLGETKSDESTGAVGNNGGDDSLLYSANTTTVILSAVLGRGF